MLLVQEDVPGRTKEGLVKVVAADEGPLGPGTPSAEVEH